MARPCVGYAPSVPARETLECKTPASLSGCMSQVSAASESRLSRDPVWRADSCGDATPSRIAWTPHPLLLHQARFNEVQGLQKRAMCPDRPSAACRPPDVSDAVLSGSQRSRAAAPSCGVRLSRFHDHERQSSRSSAHPSASMHIAASAMPLACALTSKPQLTSLF